MGDRAILSRSFGVGAFDKIVVLGLAVVRLGPTANLIAGLAWPYQHFKLLLLSGYDG